MKQGLLILSAIFILSSCEINVFEQPFDHREQFLGAYEVQEYSETYGVITVFPVEIVTNNDPFSDEIYLRNFYDLGIEVYGLVQGNRFTIPRQRIGDFMISGTGSINSGDLLMTYSVEDLSDPRLPIDFCNAVFFYG